MIELEDSVLEVESVLLGLDISRTLNKPKAQSLSWVVTDRVVGKEVFPRVVVVVGPSRLFIENRSRLSDRGSGGYAYELFRYRICGWL